MKLPNMRIDASVAAAIFAAGLGGSLRGVPNGNRVHTERARPGSPEALANIAAAEARRRHRAAKRAALSC